MIWPAMSVRSLIPVQRNNTKTTSTHGIHAAAGLSHHLIDSHHNHIPSAPIHSLIDLLLITSWQEV